MYQDQEIKVGKTISPTFWRNSYVYNVQRVIATVDI